MFFLNNKKRTKKTHSSQENTHTHTQKKKGYKCTKGCCKVFFLGFVDDPSAGSPTDTLLRLLLPLNDQV
jgi:hypothetical protein